MKILLRVAALGVLALALMPYARAQSSGAVPDILGLKLGMTPDQVSSVVKSDLKNPSRSPFIGHLALKSYRSPKILFGESYKDGENAQFGELNKEFFFINYSFPENPRVIYISRSVAFDQASAPTVQSYVNAAIAKYGKPVAIDHPGSPSLRITWNWGGNIHETKAYNRANGIYADCTSWVQNNNGPFLWLRQINTTFTPAEVAKIYPQCAITMTLEIQTIANNPFLVASVAMQVGDFNALGASYVTMLKTAQAGAAAAEKKADQHAVTNAPRL
ncbi:MAG: hypothetical protein KGL12_04465 [Rhodospirillales bacterium]|nr:hypothetical protein [Rhodospirillales bacterium]